MSKTTEEKSKQQIAKRVIAPKRRYFVPEQGMVEASSLEDVSKQLTNKLKKQEDGDGDK